MKEDVEDEEENQDNDGEQEDSKEEEKKPGVVVKEESKEEEKPKVKVEAKEDDVDEGALTEDLKKYLSKGKYKVPRWARMPKHRRAIFQIMKNDDLVNVVALGNSPSLILGRQREYVDHVMTHPSISRQHAAIVHDKHGRLQLIDLGSQWGVFVNKRRIRPNRPHRLREREKVSFGGSSRKYVVHYRFENESKNARKADSDDEPLDYSEETKNDEKDEPRRKKQKREKEKVRCSHILVKHRESRRPSSWREATITRSREEAVVQIKDFRQQILNARIPIPSMFENLAKTYSDCSSARNGGDLGFFSRKKMQKPFEDASFALSIGQLSQVVISDSGIHLILRTG